jgi:hypothetical protein
MLSQVIHGNLLHSQRPDILISVNFVVVLTDPKNVMLKVDSVKTVGLVLRDVTVNNVNPM